jgi:hypothetical protein
MSAGADDPEPADVLLALGERPVGDEHVAAAGPQDRGRVRRVQAAGEHPGARGPHLGVHRVDVAHDRLEDLGRRRVPVRLVDAQQVLLHLGHPLRPSRRYVGFSTPTRIGPARIDSARENLGAAGVPARTPLVPVREFLPLIRSRP